MKILSEPKVIPSFRGLVPVVETDEGVLYIAAKSLMLPLLKLLELNGGKWTGIEAKIYKATEEKMAPYIVEHPSLSESVASLGSTQPKSEN